MRKEFFLLMVLYLVAFSIPASADSYGDGSSSPLPNITNISVYDVTDGQTRQENETGGQLIDFGLNSTLKVAQSEQRTYRFEFQIQNKGTDWTLQDSDNIVHRGLNDSWNVKDVWYNISADQDYDGGSSPPGRVEWDTSLGGTVAADNFLYAKYIVEVEDPNSTNYTEYFEINDSSSDSGSYDYHNFFVEKLGYLNLSIVTPPYDSVVVVNNTFGFNGSVRCEQGRCGSVTMTPRYNQSSTADTQIPQTGEPFNTNVTSKTCNLRRGERCYTNFFVNASGPLESFHLLDFSASSSRNIPDNDSDDNLVQINTARIINVTWEEADFGLLDPGSTDVPALGNNDRKYNVTVDSRSSDIEGLWIRASDMRSKKLDYTIPAENLSYSFTNDISTEKSLMNTFQLASSNLSPGDILTTYFWIDVPLGIYNGGYTGTIYFKANATN